MRSFTIYRAATKQRQQTSQLNLTGCGYRAALQTSQFNPPGYAPPRRSGAASPRSGSCSLAAPYQGRRRLLLISNGHIRDLPLNWQPS